MAYPVFYHHASVLIHTPVIEEITRAVDPTVRTPVEAGYVVSRARFTRATRQWKVTYEMMSKTNRDTLATFETTQNVGGDSFAWTEPVDSASVTVRFQGSITYAPVPGTNRTRWNVSFVFEEV